MITHSFSLKIYPHLQKITPGGRSPIYARIIVNRKIAVLALKRSVDPKKWDEHRQRVKGNIAESRQLNSYIDQIRSKILEIQQDILRKGISYTARLIKDIYTGKHSVSSTLLDLFRDHNKKMSVLAEQGHEYTPGTLERYETTLRHVQEFLASRGQDDVRLSELSLKFVHDFEFFLKTRRNCSNNTTVKYIKNLHKIVLIAYRNEWISRDPFLGYKGRLEKVDREVLSAAELEAIEQKEIPINRLSQIRDIFVFSCYTGLRYSDIFRLNRTHIKIYPEGENWLEIETKKTREKVRIPLLPVPLEIIKRYENHPVCQRTGILLPVLSNQKTNVYLKELAVITGIDKNLTFHTARHTFATTVTLLNGMPIETVSKLLGHTQIKTTQIYARVLDEKISKDMKALREKLNTVKQG